MIPVLLLALSAPTPVALWHSYAGKERKALELALERFDKKHPELKVNISAVPFEALADKLTAAIPRGHGPDVFIFAHDRLGGWVEGGLVSPIELFADEATLDAHARSCVDALAYQGALYGLPLAYKTLALYVRTDIIETPPDDLEALIQTAKQHTDPSEGRYGLAYGNVDFFFHAPLHLSAGGAIYPNRQKDEIKVISEGASAGLAIARRLAQARVVPPDPNQAAFAGMFSEGRAPMVISGPWFRASIDPDVPYTVAPLPAFGGARSSGFSTCEGVMMSAQSKHPAQAYSLMHYLSTDPEAATLRMLQGAQSITHTAARQAALPDLSPAERAIVEGFVAAFSASTPAPKFPSMAAVWTPMNAALYQVIHQGTAPKAALVDAQSRIDRALKR